MSRSGIATPSRLGIHSLSLRANFAWTLAGNSVYAGCQWGMLVVLAKLGPPEIVGQFALALAVAAPVIMFANLQLRGIQATDARGEYCFSEYISVRLATTVLAMLLIGGIVMFSDLAGETALVVLAVGLAKSVESVSDVLFGFLQQRERMDRIAKSMIAKGLLSLIALGLAVYSTGSVLYGCLALVATWTLVLILYDLPSSFLLLTGGANVGKVLRGYPLEPWPWRRWRRLLDLVRLGAPLGFVMVLISLNTNVPRYFVERYLGSGDLGIFAALAYLMVAGTTVVSALGQSASPRLARHYACGERGDFVILLLKLLSVGIALGLAGVAAVLLWGEGLLAFVYKPEYAGRADILVWIMLAAGVGYPASLLGYGMTAARRFAAQAPLFVIVCGTTLVGSALLVPDYGLMGAALAVLAASVIQLVGSGFILLGSLRSFVKSG